MSEPIHQGSGHNTEKGEGDKSRQGKHGDQKRRSGEIKNINAEGQKFEPANDAGKDANEPDPAKINIALQKFEKCFRRVSLMRW